METELLAAMGFAGFGAALLTLAIIRSVRGS